MKRSIGKKRQATW